jgi:5-(carboxyamino)imidazole ribonucleotide synthase
VLETLDVVGVMCVEFFLTRGGELLVNELAPRPHNSGHLTFDACVTSQFEQQLRAVCCLPLGSTELMRPAAMANLLGDLWLEGEPDWREALKFTDVKLHLYGKTEPRAGRKMGHLTALAPTPEEAARKARAARSALTRTRPS